MRLRLLTSYPKYLAQCLNIEGTKKCIIEWVNKWMEGQRSCQKTGGIGSVEDKRKGKVRENFLRVVQFCISRMLKRMKDSVDTGQI